MGRSIREDSSCSARPTAVETAAKQPRLLQDQGAGNRTEHTVAAHDPAQDYPASKGQTEGPGSNGGEANNMLDDEDLFQALKNRKTERQSDKVLKRPSAAPGTDGEASCGSKNKGRGKGKGKKGSPGAPSAGCKKKGQGKGSEEKRPYSTKKQGKSHDRPSLPAKHRFPIVWEPGASLKVYASRMYKRAGTWARQQGFSKEKALETRRTAHQEAAALWRRKSSR